MALPIKVLVVDDSCAMRMLLTEILSADPELRVVGAACDPFEAREMIKTLKPDVLTLDVEMPRMDGLTFLEKLMRLRPMPVVMVSSLTQRGCEVTLEALSLGAVDFVPKPTVDTLKGLGMAAEEIRTKVKAAARCRVQTHAPTAVQPAARAGRTSCRCIAIGASTGGTEAILRVLSMLPANIPPVFVVQHIPGGFSGPFAARVNLHSQLNVMTAEHGMVARPGDAYIAHGGEHLEVKAVGSQLQLVVHEGPPVNLHRPSVDVLFRSVADRVGDKAIGVMLTGMGADGAEEMRRMHDAGARTIAQDEASCVVFGMPARAIQLGAVDDVRPLDAIARRIVELLANE